LHFHSHIMRLNCAKLARLAGAALLALCIAGCQSNADRDLIARDRRMQEDQMYAMQDYIQQYQQLVCRFRSENASLRRQLNDDRSGTAVDREPLSTPRTPVIPPATNRTPNLPGSTPRQVPSPNIEVPDVPPLGQETWMDTLNRYPTCAEHESKPIIPDRYSEIVSYETPVAGVPAPVASEGVAVSATGNARSNDSTTRNMTADVILSGEVVANESGGGPRLMIDIESLDESGHIKNFDGNVSLALLASDGGVQRRVARWDFGPEDVRAAANSTASEPKMRFRVELPAGTKIDGETELWAKFAPANGARLFSHAKLCLTKPGFFSSRSDKIPTSEQSVIQTSYVDTSTQPADIALTTSESTWATAKPGKPAILQPESDSTSGWKAASELLPQAVVITKPAAMVPMDSGKTTEAKLIQGAPAKSAQKPLWTAERPGTASRATRPNWSAVR
jgi:hypothetical protein